MQKKKISESEVEITPQMAIADTLNGIEESIKMIESNINNINAIQNAQAARCLTGNNYLKTCSESLRELNDRTNLITILNSILIEVRKLPKEIVIPRPEPVVKQERKTVTSIFRTIFRKAMSDDGALVITVIVSTAAAFMLLSGMYFTTWSADAWARRAYDAAWHAGSKNPGKYYQETRMNFALGNFKTAKGYVLDTERKARRKEEEL